ncbi:NUDIX domain-containing protein [Actinoplanes sp. NPDC051851]|uniref:NUDIX hydrolase n=1 Tax=Actinoplanes sp. NPDC051851 TaxID=3154753 RepID=UPI0034269413
MPASEYVRNLRAKVGQEMIMFPTVSAVILNDAGEILLHQRSDTGQWTLIAGMMDPGDQPADTVIREVEEETALQVKIERLAGVMLHELTYPNGDVCQMMNTWFRCRAVGGEARVNDSESLAVEWFPLDALPELNDFALHRIRTALDESAPAWFAAPDEKIPDGW